MLLLSGPSGIAAMIRRDPTARSSRTTDESCREQLRPWFSKVPEFYKPENIYSHRTYIEFFVDRYIYRTYCFYLFLDGTRDDLTGSIARLLFCERGYAPSRSDSGTDKGACVPTSDPRALSEGRESVSIQLNLDRYWRVIARRIPINDTDDDLIIEEQYDKYNFAYCGLLV